MSEGKFYWHVHHDVLLGWSDNIKKRRTYIKREKPTKEIPLRLKLLKPVRGNLPDEVVGAWAAYRKAEAAYDKARAACDKARAACDEAWVAYNKAQAAYCKAGDACDKARAACDEAWAAYRKAEAAYREAEAARDEAGAVYREALADHQEEIEALHRRECPDCPWDGKTIFSGKEDVLE